MTKDHSVELIEKQNRYKRSLRGQLDHAQRQWGLAEHKLAFANRTIAKFCVCLTAYIIFHFFRIIFY